MGSVPALLYTPAERHIGGIMNKLRLRATGPAAGALAMLALAALGIMGRAGAQSYNPPPDSSGTMKTGPEPGAAPAESQPSAPSQSQTQTQTGMPSTGQTG